MINDLSSKLEEGLSAAQSQLKQDFDHKVMCMSMINILDERVNAQEGRIFSLEKLTKEVHSAV